MKKLIHSTAKNHVGDTMKATVEVHIMNITTIAKF